MKNPYKSNEQTLISFSGGRTSAYLLWKVIDAYDGALPNNFHVCFANTGKEMPETLDFVYECEKNWGIKITWLERFVFEISEDQRTGNKKYCYDTRIVDYTSASRHGEPFRSLILAKKYAPNVVARFCTQELKVNAIHQYIENIGLEFPIHTFIGIRADEPRRAAKMHNQVKDKADMYLPLYVDGVTKQDVHNFWKSQPFNLRLPSNDGTTDWGNCDLCFLKGTQKKLAIIKEREDLADWWIQQEEYLDSLGKKHTGNYFNAGAPSYRQMKIIATSQPSFDFGIDETIPCFCGE